MFTKNCELVLKTATHLLTSIKVTWANRPCLTTCVAPIRVTLANKPGTATCVAPRYCESERDTIGDHAKEWIILLFRVAIFWDSAPLNKGRMNPQKRRQKNSCSKQLVLHNLGRRFGDSCTMHDISRHVFLLHAWYKIVIKIYNWFKL